MPILKINPNIILGEGSFGINIETECLNTTKKPDINIKSKNCDPQNGKNKFVLKLCKDDSHCINYKNEEILGKLLANDKKIPVTAIHKNLLYIIEEIELAESVKTLLAETLAIKAIEKGNQLNVSLFSRKGLLMPYYNMGSLSEYIRFNQRGLSIDTIIIDDIFFAVRFLHSINCVHLDIKPANIMLHCSSQNEYKAVIIDYGFSQSIKEDINFGNGSKQYMSPELLSSHYGFSVLYNKGPDIWALGIVILEICMKQYSAWYHFYFLIKEKYLTDDIKRLSEVEQQNVIQKFISQKIYTHKSSIVNFTEFKQYYIDKINNITIAKNEYNIEEFLNIFFNLNHDERILLYDELGYKSNEEIEQYKRINIDNTHDAKKIEEMIKKTTKKREDETKAIETANKANKLAIEAVIKENMMKKENIAQKIKMTFSASAKIHRKREVDTAVNDSRQAIDIAQRKENDAAHEIGEARIMVATLVEKIIKTVINKSQQNKAAQEMRRRVASMPVLDEELNVARVATLESEAVSRETKRNIPYADAAIARILDIESKYTPKRRGQGKKTKRKMQIKRRFIQKTRDMKKKLSKNRKRKNRKTQQKKIVRQTI